MASQSFPKTVRIRRPNEYERVFKSGQSVRERSIRIFGVRNDGLETRLGLAVSKRVGNAVVRGRWKRLCREAFRLTRQELPAGIDFVVIPAASQIPSLAELQTSLRKGLQRLDRLLPPRVVQAIVPPARGISSTEENRS